jgi:hypothetical protein
MAAAPRLRAYTDALTQLTTAIASSTGSVGSAQLGRLQQQVVAAAPGVRACPSLGADERAALQAALDLCMALADGRHARDRAWLQLLPALMEPYCLLLDKCAADKQGLAAWQQQQGGSAGHSRDRMSRCAHPEHARPRHHSAPRPAGPGLLPQIGQLLTGITAVMRAEPASSDVQPSAPFCLMTLVELIQSACSPDVLQRALPQVAAATELADLLLTGGAGSRAGAGAGSRAGGCSCGLASARDATLCSRAAVRGVVAGGTRLEQASALVFAKGLGKLLQRLTELHFAVRPSHADEMLLASKGGLQLMLRDLALRVAGARRPAPQPAGGGRARRGDAGAAGVADAGHSGIPACTDLSLFLGGWRAEAVNNHHWPAMLLLEPVIAVAVALSNVLAASGAAACPRCAPQQLLLLLEATLMYKGAGAAAVALQGKVVSGIDGLIRAQRPGWESWLPLGFLVPAVRMLSAWLLAAAEQLAVPPPADAPGGSASDMLALAATMHIGLAMVLGSPGKVIEAPQQHGEVPMQQLLGSCEVVLRTQMRLKLVASVELGLIVLQVSGLLPRLQLPLCVCPVLRGLQASCVCACVGRSAFHAWSRSSPPPLQSFILHEPACFEAMWHCGALPGLIITVAKGPRNLQTDDVHSMAALLHCALRAPARGEQPWYAASAERQQFVLLLIARVGGRAGARLLESIDGGARAIGIPADQEHPPFIDRLHAAGRQLAQQPLLRRQLEVAAPALLPRAEAVGALSQAWTSEDDPRDPSEVVVYVAPEPLQLLAALAQQLDPLALGLRLPGCYNPACTSLAGASEVAMKMKVCASCKVAR